MTYEPLLKAIKAETAGIDAAIYIIEFHSLADAIISRQPGRCAIKAHGQTSNIGTIRIRI